MKTVSMIAALLGLITVCCAQDIPQNELPSIVLNSFKSAFPQAQDADWEAKGDIYNVEFDLGNVDHEVWIDKTGKIIKHETDLDRSQVPAKVKSAVTAKYKNMTIDDIDKIEKDGKVYYRLELDGKTGDLDIFVDESGNELKDASFLY